MTLRTALLALPLAALPLSAGAAHADARDEVARCAAILDDTQRLACFDAAAASLQAERNAAAEEAAATLKREFRFDRNAMTGPLSFRIQVSGNLVLSRETAAAREVEKTARRITKALGEIEGWKLSITVHGGQVSLSRGHPYSGVELLEQSETGMANSGLLENRYTITQGPDAEPDLWDDGRVRSANEHIDIEIIGLGTAATR